MELTSKANNDFKIKVESKNQRIIIRNGFVKLLKGLHYNCHTISENILIKNYIIPDNVILVEK